MEKPAASRFRRRLRADYQLYLLVLPCIVFMVIFHYIPMNGIIMAFQDYNITKGIGGSAFVGFAHFADMFGNDLFLQALRNTIWIKLLNYATGLPAPLIMAIVINKVGLKLYCKTMQSITYFPYFLSWIVINDDGDENHNFFVDYLRENTLYDFEYTFFIQEDPENRNVLIASGQVFDIIGWPSDYAADLPKLLGSGYITMVDGYLDLAPTAVAQVPELLWKAATLDGGRFSLPMSNNSGNLGADHPRRLVGKGGQTHARHHGGVQGCPCGLPGQRPRRQRQKRHRAPDRLHRR